MRIITSIAAIRKTIAQLKRKGKTIGFVPTMGYFHEGHLALMRRAKKECDVCVVSIYVNPKQFGPQEDFSKYPRDFKRDATMARKENVDIVFYPSDNELYPQGYLTYIDVLDLSTTLCGAFRPGHFKGVATIVAKLLNIVEPDKMYLGAKDAQQVVVLKTMVKDLNYPVAVRVHETLRDQDGLALSSRNVYLTPAQRLEAPVLYQALKEAKAMAVGGQRQAAVLLRHIKDRITRKTSGQIQYIACVDAMTLKPVQRLEGEVLIALAVYFSKTRLIDNVIIRLKQSRGSKS